MRGRDDRGVQLQSRFFCNHNPYPRPFLGSGDARPPNPPRNGTDCSKPDGRFQFRDLSVKDLQPEPNKGLRERLWLQTKTSAQCVNECNRSHRICNGKLSPGVRLSGNRSQRLESPAGRARFPSCLGRSRQAKSERRYAVNTPGFTGEASLYRSSAAYYGGVQSAGPLPNGVAPAIPFCGNCDEILERCSQNHWRPRAVCNACAAGDCFSGVEVPPERPPWQRHPWW